MFAVAWAGVGLGLLGAAESWAATLERLAPNAAGLAFAEVVAVAMEDHRGGDGPLVQVVKLKLLGRSGATFDAIHIVKESGGHPAPPGSPPRTAGPPSNLPAKLDAFRPGARHWLAFASQHDSRRHPQGLVAVWPEAAAPPELAAALRADHFREEPQFHPESGLTHAWRPAADGKSWRVRVLAGGRVQWERDLPGRKQRDQYPGEWTIRHRDQWPSGLGHADANRSGHFLLAESAVELAADNEFGLPAGPHRLTHGLDADTGKTAVVWATISRLSPTASPALVRYYDLKTGKPKRDERSDFLTSGGKAAGAGTESWLRKVVRNFDPVTGRQLSEQTLRHATFPDGSRFVPVEKP